MPNLQIFKEGTKVIINDEANGAAIAIDEHKLSWAKYKSDPLRVYLIYEDPIENRQVRKSFLITEIVDDNNVPYASDYTDFTDKLSKKLK